MNDERVVYVVDDDEAVLLSVKALLDQHAYDVSCFSSAEKFLEVAPIDCPGCVITDLQMPGLSGLDLQQRLAAMGSQLSVVVVSGVADVSSAVRFMEAGAVTLLEKPYEESELLGAVDRGLAESRERWRKQQDASAVLQRLDTLSEDERAVMHAMLSNEPNKAIAYKLSIAMRTVDRRRNAVLEKMRVSSLTELAALLGPQRPTQLNASDAKSR